MYEKTISLLIKSNLGSFIKEDIIISHLIEKDREDTYYEGINRILLSNKKRFVKDDLLMKFLKQNKQTKVHLLEILKSMFDSRTANI